MTREISFHITELKSKLTTYSSTFYCSCYHEWMTLFSQTRQTVFCLFSVQYKNTIFILNWPREKQSLVTWKDLELRQWSQRQNSARTMSFVLSGKDAACIMIPTKDSCTHNNSSPYCRLHYVCLFYPTSKLLI